jgi:hypothetical protein
MRFYSCLWILTSGVDHFLADENPILELDFPLGKGDTRPLVRPI